MMGIIPTEAFFDQFFQQQQQQHHHRQGQGQGQGQGEISYQDRFYRQECNNGFICPDTLTCVKRASECPCPFPDSQIKCILPGNNNKKGTNSYVCISKGDRDCKFVIDAYKGLV